jgi:hypothetical protein
MYVIYILAQNLPEIFDVEISTFQYFCHFLFNTIEVPVFLTTVGTYSLGMVKVMSLFSYFSFEALHRSE